MAERQQRQAEGRSRNVSTEGYKLLDDSALDAIRSTLGERFFDLHEKLDVAYQDERSRDIELISRDIEMLSPRIGALNAEYERRKQVADKKAETDKEKMAADDAEFVEMAKIQSQGRKEAKEVGDIKRTKEEVADFQLRATNADRREQGLSEFASYDELWDEVQKERRKFDKADRNQGARQELDRLNKERIERGEKTLNLAEQQELERKELEEENKKRRERGEPELSVFEHKLEKSKTEREEKAREATLEAAKNSPEYQAEQILKPLLAQIDGEISKHEKIFEEYQRESLWFKLKNREAKKSGKRIERLREARSELLAEETFYTSKKKDLAEKYKLLLESGDAIYLIADRTNPKRGAESREASVRIKKLEIDVAVIEEIHEERKGKILDKLSRYGLDVSGSEEKAPTDLREAGVYSQDLRENEQEWMHLERGKLEESFFDGKIGFFESQLEKHALTGGRGSIEKRDREIQIEIEKYKRKVLETRLRVRRMMVLMETEAKKENKGEINLDLLSACTREMQAELRGLKKYEEILKNKVIAIGLKSRVQKALKDSKFVNAIGDGAYVLGMAGEGVVMGSRAAASGIEKGARNVQNKIKNRSRQK